MGEDINLDEFVNDHEKQEHKEEREGNKSEEDKDPMIESIKELVRKKFEEIDDLDRKVDLLNELREELSDLSPFEEAVDHIHWEKIENVEGNAYNPNEVAKPEMDLLHKSIKEDTFTQPIVSYEIEEDYYEIVDGFHRNLIVKNREDIKERTKGYLPLTIIDKPIDERMSSTIRHNRARGTHQINDMSTLVVELIDQGWNDERIAEELGMEMDEVIRLKQHSGLKKAFTDHEFSDSWEEFEKKYYKEDQEDGEEE